MKSRALCLNAIIWICAAIAHLAMHGLALHADDVKAKAGDIEHADPKLKIEEAANQQERLRRQFEEFKQGLLRLKQRLESSSKPEDREKAQVLTQAIAKASEQGTDVKFTTLVAALRGSEVFKDLDQLQTIVDKNADLRKDIHLLIELLLKDDRESQLKREREEYARMLERLKEVILKQEKARSQTEAGRKSAEELEKLQKKVSDETNDLLAKKDSKNSADKGLKKAESKDAGKNSKEARGESKDDTKDPKGDAKKEGSKPSEAKKPAEAKDNKPGETKPAESKDGKPGDSKPGENKSNPAKPSDSKDSDSKGRSDGKAESKPGSPQNKPSDSSPKPGESRSDPKGQQPGQSKPDGQQNSGDQQEPSDGQKQAENPAKKQIEEARQHQEKAEKDLNQKKNQDAVAKQDKAIEKLKDAQKKLEELLKQLREEEIERTLAALQARCERMLAMQIGVRDGTVALDKGIDKKEPSREQQQVANELSDKEEEIIREANKAVGVIQAEGSAVAFAEVFLQVRGDMNIVAGRLRRTDTSTVTQTIENDIIATLQEMIEALKKARKENQNKQQQQQQQQQQGGGQPDQKLIDMIAELKMIRSMQLRVNNRTEVYGKQYDGEQAPLPTSTSEAKLREQYETIQKELRDLAERQFKIEKVTGDIAKGKNKAN